MNILAILFKAIAYIIIGVSAVATIVWTALITWTAFVGGQAPYSFIDFDGVNALRGLFWLVIVDPILVGVVGVLVFLCSAPLLAIAESFEKRAG